MPLSTSRIRRAQSLSQKLGDHQSGRASSGPGAPSTKATRHSHELHMGFDAEEKTLLDGHNAERDHDQGDGKEPFHETSDDEDLTFSWNEEQSILAYLMEDGPKQSDQDRLDALVDSLKTPFEAKSKQLIAEMAETFLPAVRHVRKAHRVLEATVDHDFAKGITVFNSACKVMDAGTLAEYEELTEAYEKTRDNIANLMDQLKAEYAHRDRLWMDLEKGIDEIADPALADLQDLPGEVERIIAKLEKGYETMQNPGKEKTLFSEQRLKDLLTKIGETSLVI